MLAFADRDRFTGPQIMAHDFGKELAPAADLGSKTLADNVAKAVGQTNSQLLFLAQ